MNCPKCQHDAKLHHDRLGCCWRDSEDYCTCQCELTEAQAISAAQRAAAIAHLREIGAEWKCYHNAFKSLLSERIIDRQILDNSAAARMKIFVTLAAYRAVGILKGPKP